MSKRAERELQNALARALCVRGLVVDAHAAAETLRETGTLARLGDFFPLRRRLSCTAVARACLPLLGEPPTRDWCALAYGLLRARMYPDGGFAPNAAAYDHGVLFFLTILQTLLERERHTLPFDPMRDFDFLAPEEYESCDHAEEYRRFLSAFHEEFVYELLRLSEELTPYRTLSHIAGVHHLALTVARGLRNAGVGIDLALVSAAAATHDLGKYGCRPGEAVPHLHYYYTGLWLEQYGLNAISHIAANHSTWDLELDTLSVESLCLIYADVRCRQGNDAQGLTVFYSLADAFDVILQKLENVDAAKRRRYELVYSRLQDFERYLRALGVDVALTGSPDAPVKPKDPALMNDEEAIEQLMLRSTEHQLKLMHLLSGERRFGNIIEAARASRDWTEIRVYLNIFEAYGTYLSAQQKTQALAFLYELLSHREGDIRRQAASLIGQIIARFHLVYRKRLPDDAPSDPAEEVPFTLWEEYLEKIVNPDHKTSTQQRAHIGYALKLVVDALLKNGRSETIPRFVGALLAYYDAPETKAADTAFTLLDAIRDLPARYYDEATRGRLIEFAAYFAQSGDVRLQTAALLFLREAQRALTREHPQMRRIAEIAAHSPADDALTLAFLRCYILCHAGGDISACHDLLDGTRNLTGEVFLDNLKTATPWVNKVVGVELLKARAKREQSDNILHIATHFSNLIKVSERVVVRHAAGAALLEILPLLRREQRNEVVVELGKGIELGRYAISKYIPDTLGKALLLLHPSELDEQMLWLRALLGAPTDSAVAGALRTVGVILQDYTAYRGRFAEPAARYTERLHELLGLLLQGLASDREAVRQEALLVFGQLFDEGGLGMEERERLFTLCCRKLLILMDDAPDQDALTLFYRAFALSRIERFLTLHKLERGDFRFERPRKVAFFPGTFDPFTRSHEGIVRKIREMGFEVYLAVDEFSWSKKPQPHLLRRQIINMSTAGDFHVYLFPDEIPINIANPDDLRHLRELFAPRLLYLVVGADVIAGASAYQKKPEPHSVHSLHHIVFRRPDQPKLPSKKELRLSGDVMELRLPPELEEISSSRIRENVDQNRDISHLIDPIVQDFIYQNGLYLRDSQNKPLLLPSGIAFSWLAPPYAGIDHPALIEAAQCDDELLALRRGETRVGFMTWRYLAPSDLFGALGDAALSDRVRLRAGGKILLISGIYADGDDAQLLLSEVLARSLQEDCVYALCRMRGGLEPEQEALLARQGFVRREGDEPLLEVDLRAPTVLIRNLATAIQEPLSHDARVLAAIMRGHERLQQALTALYPGALVLTLSSDVIHQRLLERVTAFNHVPDTPTVPKTLGECMCVPFGKLLRGRILPNTVTKTIHTDKVYEPDLRSSRVEAFPHYPPIASQVRMIRSFRRPVILVDDVMHPGTRIRALDPLLRQEDIEIRMVLVGLLSGHGRDLMREENRPVDGAYFVPTLRQWFVESTLYPFVGGDTVRRATAPVPGLLPGINHILPYAAPPYRGECPERAVFELSRCCLEAARDLMLALEATYREQYARNLTLSRLSEAVILPLCPDKGACLRYDPSLAASVYLENDWEQLMRSAGG